MIKLQGLTFDLQISGGKGLDFSVVEFTLEEKLSELFTLTLSVVSPLASHGLKPFLFKRASLYIYSDGIMQRRIEGIITTFERGQSGTKRTFYTLIIRPRLWLLTLRQNSRIFHKKTTPEILNILFDEHELAYECRLEDEHKIREYTVQRRETDYDFVARLAAEEGIAIWAQNLNGENEHTFYADGWEGLTCCTTIDYNVHPQSSRQGAYLYDLRFGASVTPQRMVGKDNTYLNPDYPFRHEHALSESASAGIDPRTHYDSHARFHFPAGDTGDNFARYRLEQLQTESELGKAKSNCIKLRAGSYFSLKQHPDGDMNRFWQVIDVVHHGTLPQSLEEDIDGTGAYLTNRLTFMDSRKSYRPPFRPKPTADGAETAVVCGPAGEEIYTNKLGQVLVHFHWNLLDKADENASCWVRVAQGWNGGQYGFYAIPRIGQEVIITYLNNDLDRPIITGCVYNEKHQPPLKLPGNKTKSIFKSHMHKGEGYNQLILDDTTHQLGARLHSTPGETQLNMGVLVHPRDLNGMGEHRGDGFELRTDDWGAIRAGKGLYISTDKREKAGSDQLDLQEAIAQLEQSLELAKSLAQATKTAGGLPADIINQTHQIKNIHTELKKAGILISSPAGIALATPKSVQVSAEKNIALTAGKHANLSAANNYTVSAGDAISLFSVNKEIKCIANKGVVQIQAQHNTLEITSRDNLDITSANANVEIAAKDELILSCGGAYIKLKGGNIEFGAPGEIINKSSQFFVTGPATESKALPKFTPVDISRKFWFSG